MPKDDTTTQVRVGKSRRIVIREVRCKTILNRTTISDYSLNCYTGCAHGCVYCYVCFMQRFQVLQGEWLSMSALKAKSKKTK